MCACAEFQVHVSMATYVSDFEYYCVTVFVCDDIGMHCVHACVTEVFLIMRENLNN